MSLESLLARDPDAVLRMLDKLDSEQSLASFMKLAWPQIIPDQLIWGWHLDAICEHLEAVARGEILRLVVNVPPGTSKSTSIGVIFPAWLWGPGGQPSHRYIGAAHEQGLAIRDNRLTRELVTSEWYQTLWPLKLTGDQNEKRYFENEKRGFRQACAVASMTGRRGNTVAWDDPLSPEKAFSKPHREEAIRILTETLPTRLVDPRSSAIIIMMQRLHEEDPSGYVLEHDLGYEHLMLPMEFDPQRKCVTSIGFEDPRTEEGELLCPERFPPEVIERDKRGMSDFAVAGQFQQSPIPAGGGIIRADDWIVWDEECFPPFEYVVASLDSAYTEKEENDYSALTIWGVWNEQAGRRIAGSTVPDIVQDNSGTTRIMLMYAWQKRLELHGRYVNRLDGETDADWQARQKQEWGLVEWVADSCQRYKVHKLLIEAKASGLSVAQEIRRLIPNRTFGVEASNPGAENKVARAHSVQPIFAEGMVYAPGKYEHGGLQFRKWADEVVMQCAAFPKAKHDDLVDSAVQALRHLRDSGILRATAERIEDTYEAMQLRKPLKPLYPV